MTTLAVTNDVQTVKQPASGESIDGTSTLSQSLATLPGSSNAPKFGTLIPNRIFVGGIPANTTEQELKLFFSAYGSVRDAKIVTDRSGLSKGRYGFVTFETQEMAEKVIKNESENLIFKDRKLNIGHAIRKQQVFPRADVPPGTVFFTSGAVPYTFQNGMAVFQVPGGVGTQDYGTAAALMAAAQPASYTTMMVPQPTVYVPQPHYTYQAPGVTSPSHLGGQWGGGAQVAVASGGGNGAGHTANSVPSTTQAQQPQQSAQPSTPTMMATSSAQPALPGSGAGASSMAMSAGQWTGNRWGPQSPTTATSAIAQAPLQHASAYAVYGPLASASSTPAAGNGDAPTTMIYHAAPHHLAAHHAHPGAAMIHPTLLPPPHQQTTTLNSSATSDYSSEHGTGSTGTSLLDTTTESESSPARMYHAHPLDAATACLSPYSPVAAAAGWSGGATAHIPGAAPHLQSEPLIALAPPHHLAHTPHHRMYSAFLPQQSILQQQAKATPCPVTAANAATPIVSLMKHAISNSATVPRSGTNITNGQSTSSPGVTNTGHQSLVSVANGNAPTIEEAKVYNPNAAIAHDH